MCGIAGISYGPEGPQGELWSPTEFAQILFPAMVHRGPHAFGYMYYDGEFVVTQKFVGRSDNARVVREIEIPDNVQWLVLHVRFATTGDPAQEINNHPIWHGDYVGVHNGVVRNFKSVLTRTGRYETEDGFSEVDSEAIFAAVQKYGHIKGLNEVDYDGVAVYTNINQNPWTLHFARTINRPMKMTDTTAGSKIFASEEEIVDATGIDHNNFTTMSSYKLWRLREGKIVERITFRDDSLYDLPRTPVRNSLQVPRKPLSGITDRMTAKLAEEDAQRTKERFDREMRERRPRADVPRSEKAHHKGSSVDARTMRDGDRFGDKFWYKGSLRSEKKFLQMVQADRKADQAIERMSADVSSAPIVRDDDSADNEREEGAA